MKTCKLTKKTLSHILPHASCLQFLRIHHDYFFTIWKQPPEVSCKKEVFLEISQNSQENTCARVSFLIKLQAKHLFYRTHPDDCFWKLCLKILIITKIRKKETETTKSRSSPRRRSVGKGAFRNFEKLKKRLRHMCFPVNFAKFLRTTFLKSTSGRLLLYIKHQLNSVYIVSRKFSTKY